MNTCADRLPRSYELFINAANLLQSPLLLVMRVYFFWQLFVTGQGKLAHLNQVTEYFAGLGIPWPNINAYLAGATETFGSLLLIVGLASRLAAVPVLITMIVAYLTADLESAMSFFSNPDKFVKADPFPFFLCALILFVFGPGKISLDAVIDRWMRKRTRSRTGEVNELSRANKNTSDRSAL